MKRYYICNIIGTGTEADSYRPAIAREIDAARVTNPTFDASYSVVIPTHPEGHPQAGHPKFPHALVIVEANNHGIFAGKPDIDSLPDVALDSKVSSMHTPTKNAMIARLAARGFNGVNVDNADGYREVIRGIGRALDTAFHEDSFDAS